MNPLYIILMIIGGVSLAVLLAALVCFLLVFYSPKRKPLPDGEYDIPKGEIYEEFRTEMVNWQKSLKTLKCEEMEIRSRDGLILRGKYYEYEKGAPLEIMFHGYRGSAERDLSGGVERCFAIGRNALIIDQRAHGRSDGHVITFGIRERKDCLSWINYARERFGSEIKIIITGVSMGAATVMLAAGEELPENVVCVLADCGYTSANEIIKKIIREMHLPCEISYFFVKLGAKIFGGFDLEETSPIEAMKKCKIPVIFIHGDTDEFVPFEMSERLYEACSAEKQLVSIPGAGHGIAYPINKELYLKALSDFESSTGFLTRQNNSESLSSETQP